MAGIQEYLQANIRAIEAMQRQIEAQSTAIQGVLRVLELINQRI